MLIECKECKKQVSDQAEACPNCGYLINPKRKVKTSEDSVFTRNRGFGDIVVYGGLFFVLILVLAFGITSC